MLTFLKFSPLGDIVVDNGLGVASSDLIEHLLDIQPETKYLYHFIRSWLALDKVTFKSYTLVMLIIYFLQTQKLLPSIKRVQKNCEVVCIRGER